MDTVDHSDLPAACALCQRTLSSDTEAGDLEAISICGDCKFLLLEDVGGTPTVDVHRRRSPGLRQTRYNSSESIENMFSQQFSNMINLARHNQPALSEHENQSLDGDARIVQRTSSRTTPSGSRRWRRVFSDTESDGLDSFGAYGGDSDASVDGRSFLDNNDMFTHPDGGSDLDSDTDIDPMHAGLNQWNSDDHEEEEEDSEWEEVDTEENTLDTLVAGVQLQRSLASNGRNFPINWRRQDHSPEMEGTIRVRISERRQMHTPYVDNSGDYLDARGFEELLERLAENENSRRGAPPAALSFVNSLECVVINGEHEEQEDGLACAICKDSLSLGTVVNRLPCFHLYHPSCILPWLSSRNSCPLCRFEFPTDDEDYESRKQSSSRRQEIHESEDSSSEISETDDGHGRIEREGGERGRGRWFFLAAPIVSLMGIALVLWLGNPLTERRGSFGHSEFSVQGQHAIQAICSPPNQRENRGRRWWSLF